MKKKVILRFKSIVWEHCAKEKRDFPWRKTSNPYHIFVSEIMLQQTQVDRVIPKYVAFIKTFPTLESLAEAKQKEVLLLWSGLGYNRRAKMLFEAAKYCKERHKSMIPNTYAELIQLPGIGPYTASAILNFAFEIPTPMIETNIRTAYLFHFFRDSQKVTDTEIMDVVVDTMDKLNPRVWFNALMDYGAWVKRVQGNLNVRGATYIKQSTFKGSRRAVRGTIISLLLKKEKVTLQKMVQILHESKERVESILADLVHERLIRKVGRSFELI